MALYVTVAQFKEEYKDIAAASDDTFINRALNAAQEALDGYLRRTVLATADSTKYFDADGDSIEGLTLYLSDMGDICSITTVTNGDATTVTSGQYTTYPKTLTDHEPSIERLRLLPSSTKAWTYTTDAENAISVAGKWGMWATVATVPDAFKVSVMELAAHMMETRKVQVFDTTAIPDAGVITVPSGWPATVRTRLAPWRRLVA